jgi:alpha-tubulin suppressor-like RCC1 family protein
VSKCTPVQEICSATNWCAVASGGNHKVAIKTDGTVWAWGNGGCGQLGDGTVTSKCSPVREISSSTNWCSVSGGSLNSSATKTDGTLWGWGSNFNGKIGSVRAYSKGLTQSEIQNNYNRTKSQYGL